MNPRCTIKTKNNNLLLSLRIRTLQHIQQMIQKYMHLQNHHAFGLLDKAREAKQQDGHITAVKAYGDCPSETITFLFPDTRIGTQNTHSTY
jgi:hypothetical protein